MSLIETPASYIRGLVSGYPSRVRQRKLIVMLQGYIDDSGSSEGGNRPSSHFVLAGYIMQEPKWEEFVDRWDVVLHKPPSIEAFKMSEANSGNGSFVGMTHELRQFKIHALSRVIEEFSEHSLALWSYLNWQDYRDVVRRKVHPKIDNPYSVLFYQIMRLAHEHQIELNKHIDVGFHKVDFIFDVQNFIGLRTLQWYSMLLTRLPEPYKSIAGTSPVFRKDEEFLGLQAADMLAWHIRRNLEAASVDSEVFNRITNGMYAERAIDKQSLLDFVQTAQSADFNELESGK